MIWSSMGWGYVWLLLLMTSPPPHFESWLVLLYSTVVVSPLSSPVELQYIQYRWYLSELASFIAALYASGLKQNRRTIAR
mmetsp:Transcript_57058/g.61768  ORF Transcript_57058/g.61768 Transcript_57058/m.61768 type:complete len:80 (-) Transcript_57058:46-285(-)